jgi:hypothetical protein
MKWTKNILILFVISLLSFRNYNTRPYGTAILTEMNVVYADFDNPLEIITPGFSQGQISLTVKGASLVSQTPGRYLLRTKKGEKECTVKLSANIDGESRSIGVEKFRIRPLPTPIAQLGGIPNDGKPKTKASVMLQSTLLSTYGASAVYNLKNRITSYKAKVISQDSIFSFQNKASYVTQGLKNVINATESGDILMFYEIESETYLKSDTLKIDCSPILIHIN